MNGCNNQLDTKYHGKFLVSNICHILGGIPYQDTKFEEQPAYKCFQLNSGKTFKRGTFKN